MSSQLSGIGYGSNAYIKPALAYLALKDMLGDKLFKNTLHYYMNLWKGKHPTPWDFFNSFNVGSAQNLNWFWQNWFFSNHYIDLKITSAKISGKKAKFSVKNVGGFAIPFDVEITYEDGTILKKHFTPEVWKNGSTFKTTIPVKQKVSWVKIEGGIFMDFKPDDNIFKN